MAHTAYGYPKTYSEITKKHMLDQEEISTGFILFGSFVSRMRRLHEGVVREIGANNPKPHSP